MTSTEVETSANNNGKTILRHNQNAGIIFERLQTFYEENELFDTVLITGEENKNNRVSIQAHRLVLSSFSEYFLKAFRDAQTVLKKNVLVFQDIEPLTLKSIIDFMYMGSINLTLDAVEGILRASVMLKIKMLIDECCEFIEENINYSNCLAWFRVARELNLQGLRAMSKKFVYMHSEQISKEKEMLTLSLDELLDLLFNDTPYSDFVEHIVHCVMGWINYEKNRDEFDTVLITVEENKNNRVSIRSSRLGLSLFSEYFLKAFRDAQTVLKENVLVLQDIEPLTLKSIIDFMYMGSINLTLDAVEGILRASVMFKIKMLIDECCEFIEENINYSNCLAWFRVARELNLQGLRALSKKLVYSHFEQISKEKEMMILNVDEIEDLLFNENPYGNFEEHIFRCVVEWVNYDKNRDEFSMKLLSMVRYQYLTPKFILENRKSVYNFSSGQELMYDWLEWHWSEENRQSDQQKPNLTQRIIRVDEYKDRFLAVVDISDSDPKEIIIQLYNPIKETWSVQKKIPLFKTKSLVSTIVINDRLIVVGGNDSNNLATNSIECLNLNTFKWTEFRPINWVRNVCQLADLNGYIYVFGGFSGWCFVDRMEAYNISTHKVHGVEFTVRRPTNMSKIAVHNGIFYVMDIFGGYLQIYDVSSNELTCKVIEKNLLRNFGFVALEGFLYVIGGEKGSCMQKTVKRYDLSSDTWSEVSSLPYPCSHIKTAMFENKIVICAKTITNDDVIAQYDIQTDKWTVLNPLSLKSSVKCATICFLTTRIN